MALIISGANGASDSPDAPSIVPAFRELCGPNNCELAALLNAKSLRALVGVPGMKTNIVQNGIHCTDLPDDGFMECSYFFETIAKLK